MSRKLPILLATMLSLSGCAGQGARRETPVVWADPAPALAQGPQDCEECNEVLRGWMAKNPWYGTNMAESGLALLYGVQLRQAHPELAWPQILDAVSSRMKTAAANLATAH